MVEIRCKGRYKGYNYALLSEASLRGEAVSFPYSVPHVDFGDVSNEAAKNSPLGFHSGRRAKIRLDGATLLFEQTS